MWLNGRMSGDDAFGDGPSDTGETALTDRTVGEIVSPDNLTQKSSRESEAPSLAMA